MTMAGAVAGILLGLLWEARLLWRTPEGPAEVLDGDWIIVEAPVEAAIRSRATAALQQAGAVSVEPHEDR